MTLNVDGRPPLMDLDEIENEARRLLTNHSQFNPDVVERLDGKIVMLARGTREENSGVYCLRLYDLTKGHFPFETATFNHQIDDSKPAGAPRYFPDQYLGSSVLPDNNHAYYLSFFPRHSIPDVLRMMR